MNQSLLFSIQKNLGTESLAESRCKLWAARACGYVRAVASVCPEEGLTCRKEQGTPPSGSLEQEQQKCASFSLLSNPEGQSGLTSPSPTPCGLSSAPLAPPQAHGPSADSGPSLRHLSPSWLSHLRSSALKDKGGQILSQGRCWPAETGPGSRNASDSAWKAKIAQSSVRSRTAGPAKSS